jgi:hypothetical protein
VIFGILSRVVWATIVLTGNGIPDNYRKFSFSSVIILRVIIVPSNLILSTKSEWLFFGGQPFFSGGQPFAKRRWVMFRRNITLPQGNSDLVLSWQSDSKPFGNTNCHPKAGASRLSPT